MESLMDRLRVADLPSKRLKGLSSALLSWQRDRGGAGDGEDDDNHVEKRNGQAQLAIDGRVSPQTMHAHQLEQMRLVSPVDNSELSPVVCNEKNPSADSAFSGQSHVSFARKLATIKTFLETEPPAAVKSPPLHSSSILCTNFQVTRSFFALLHDVNKQLVILESIRFRYPTVEGTFIVKNVGYEKSLLLHYTTDSWASTHVEAAHYVTSLSGKDVDRFSFAINVDLHFHEPHEENVAEKDDVICHLGVGPLATRGNDCPPADIMRKPYITFEFAAQFECQQRVSWDNNHGKNYVVNLVYAVNPILLEQDVYLDAGET
jgi:hypothetical protein